MENYVSENASAKESNRIGLKTCEKICESLNIDFEYQLLGDARDRVFAVLLGFPMKQNGEEVNGK